MFLRSAVRCSFVGRNELPLPQKGQEEASMGERSQGLEQHLQEPLWASEWTGQLLALLWCHRLAVCLRTHFFPSSFASQPRLSSGKANCGKGERRTRKPCACLTHRANLKRFDEYISKSYFPTKCELNLVRCTIIQLPLS